MRPFQHRAGIISSPQLTPIFDEITKLYKDRNLKQTKWIEIHETLAEEAINENLGNDRNVVVELLCFLSDFDNNSALQYSEEFTQKGIGSESSLWYASISLLNEKAGNYILAFNILQAGLENDEIKPHEFLENQYEKFKTRVIADLSSTNRLHLGTLNGKIYEYNGGLVCSDENGQPVAPDIDFFALLGYDPHRPTSSFLSSVRTSYNPSQTYQSDSRMPVMEFPSPPSVSNLKKPMRYTGAVVEETEVTEIPPDTTENRKIKFIQKDNNNSSYISHTQDKDPLSNDSMSPFLPQNDINEEKPLVSSLKKPKRKSPLNSTNIDFDDDDDDPDSFSRPINKKKPLVQVQQPKQISFTDLNSTANFPSPNLGGFNDSSSSSSSSVVTSIMKKPQSILKKPSINRMASKEEMFRKESSESDSDTEFGRRPILKKVSKVTMFSKVSDDDEDGPHQYKPRKGTPTTKPSVFSMPEDNAYENTTEILIPQRRQQSPIRKAPNLPNFGQFNDYFVDPSTMANETPKTLEEAIPFVHTKKTPDQRLCYFLLLQLVRVLEGLEEVGLHHGNLSMLSFVLRSPKEVNMVLPPFDDGSLWKQTGYSLGEVQDLSSQGDSFNDRNEVAHIFWYLATKNDWNDSHPCPRLYNKKDLWNLAFDTLLNNGDLSGLDREICNYLKSEGPGTTSQVSRLLISYSNPAM